MRILETFLQGKEGNPLTCEDGLFIHDELVAVVDGVTTDGGLLWDGKKSGCFAKEVLLECLDGVVREKSLSPEEILQRLDAALAEAVKSRGRKPEPGQYPKACIIFYHRAAGEIVSYGDCQCSINGVVHSETKRVDRLNEELRAFVLEYELLQGKTVEELAENDPGRAAIAENLQRQRAFENVPGGFGYAVLNGRGIAPSLIKRYRVVPGDEVILASDGYPVLGKDLEESEEYLQAKLKTDPLCFREIASTKGMRRGNVSFDDRAFYRFIV